MCCCMCLTAQLRILITYLFYTDTLSYLLKNNTIAIVQEIFHIQYSCNVFHHRPLFSERPPTLPSSPAPNLQSLEFPQTWDIHTTLSLGFVTASYQISLLLIIQRRLRFCYLHTQMDDTSNVCLIIKKTQLELVVFLLPFFFWFCFVLFPTYRLIW